MNERIINVNELRQDIDHSTTIGDVAILDAELNYLVDEALLRIEFEMIEAEDLMRSIGNLARRGFFES